MSVAILQPGAVLRIIKLAVLDHEMVYVGPVGAKGEDVVNNRPGRGVRLEHYATATEGRPCEIVVNAPAHWADREAVVRRALGEIGKPWDLFVNNCQHMARKARTGVAQSPQLFFFAALLVTAFFVWLLCRKG